MACSTCLAVNFFVGTPQQKHWQLEWAHWSSQPAYFSRLLIDPAHLPWFANVHTISTCC
jgi:hypothetical protein